MTYQIIGDSCLDLTSGMREDARFGTVPLTLQVGDETVVDDESFNQAKFLAMVRACPQCPKTACPSPELFLERYRKAGTDVVFVITLSCHLSGSYNSAMTAKQIYDEEQKAGTGPSTRVEVIDSLSASSGQLCIALYLQGLCESEADVDEILKKTLEYRDRMNTYFVLETLETLRKNGRLTGLKAFFATALNIKPVMGADQGTIIKLDQARGINKALKRMCDIAVSQAGDTSRKTAVIAHCNNRQRAEFVKEQLKSLANFGRIVITETAGVATLYAEDGGIVLAM